MAPRGDGVQGVRSYKAFLSEVLDRAAQVNPTASIEPELTKAELGDVSSQTAQLFATEFLPDETKEQRKLRQGAMIETAARDIFGQLIATTSIESPAFVRIWNLLDIISILSDDEECDASLLFWLVEELLDSQPIPACRKILDYLESRRERITAKHFKHKQLVILRSCNELLRRLSRAEDTSFCGRVFIFMFQSFPLGDKSSVNLRGEFHVENVTTYDQSGQNSETQPNGDAMEVDKEDATPTRAVTPTPEQKRAGSRAVSVDPRKTATATISKPPPMDADTFYPVFWSLQETFSQPKKLFDPAHFAKFKTAMETTINQFKTIEIEPRNTRASAAVDEAKKSLKRKREDDEESLANAFNPKYLTSRDLFELEIGDLSFRRHVLVQALIIMDFLLSMSDKAREKLNDADLKVQNKSVMYMDQHLSEEDAKWATDMKNSISNYLRLGMEGPYFLRMVETVLSRDKNWVRWKVENCPPISQPSVNPKEFADARSTVRANTTNKRLKNPMGAVRLGFLEQGQAADAMERLQDKTRYDLPDLAKFKGLIADADFDIEMAANNQARAAAVESKASRAWRSLRIGARKKLLAFDLIDDPDKIDAIFEENYDAEDGEDDSPVAPEADMPSDKGFVVISGPAGSGKTAIVDKMMEKRPGVFKRVVRHTTQSAPEGAQPETNVQVVTPEAFNVMVNNDQLLEFSKSATGIETGTTRRNVENVAEKGFVPVVELRNLESVQQIKDMMFPARYLLVRPPGKEVLEERLKDAGIGLEKAGEKASAAWDAEDVEIKFDKVVMNDVLDAAVEEVVAFVFSQEDGRNGSSAEENNVIVVNGDKAMEDAPASATEPKGEPETESAPARPVPEDGKSAHSGKTAS